MKFGRFMQFECPHKCGAVLLLGTGTFPMQKTLLTEVVCPNCRKTIPIGVIAPASEELEFTLG